MSAVFGQMFDPSRLVALARANTIMGGWGSVPDLPLSSRDIDLPAPSVAVPAPAIIRPATHRIDETRQLALHLHRGREHLTGWDRSFVREMIRWRSEPSAWEADQIAVLAEQHYWRIRDGAAPC